MLLLFGSALALTLGCQITQKKSKETSWSEQMLSLQESVQNLAPYFFSENQFSKPKNERVIKANLLSLSEVVHNISPEKQLAMRDADPSLKFAVQELQNNVDQALTGFQNGHKEYSRNVLKLVLNQCFYCHTRNQFGPQLQFQPLADSKVKTLSPVERADLYVAFRNYDAALKDLKAFISNPSSEEFDFQLDKAVRRYLAIAVRVKKDPKQAIEAINLLLKRENVPTYLREDSMQWKNAILSWQRERPSRNKDKLVKAKLLINGGAKLTEYPRDSAAQIYFLRASALLHDYMQAPRDQKEAAEAMFLLGLTYSNLEEYGSSFLSEFYYEACIQQMPRSPLAEKCYKAFEKSVYSGYTGTRGTYIPKSLKERLKRLKALAYRPIWPSDL
jgi:hypothetical protein